MSSHNLLALSSPVELLCRLKGAARRPSSLLPDFKNAFDIPSTGHRVGTSRSHHHQQCTSARGKHQVNLLTVPTLSLTSATQAGSGGQRKKEPQQQSARLLLGQGGAQCRAAQPEGTAALLQEALHFLHPFPPASLPLLQSFPSLDLNLRATSHFEMVARLH